MHVVAHCPADGVKVYVVVVRLFSAGDHVPVMPLLDLIGNDAKVALKQIGATCVNVGATVGFTTIVIVHVVAHCPADGVKVYVVVARLFSAGDHVPVMPLLDLIGNDAKVALLQIGATCVNVGATLGFTTIVIVAVVAH